LLCFDLLCFALCCFALLRTALLCFALHCFNLLCCWSSRRSSRTDPAAAVRRWMAQPCLRVLNLGLT
jgi:hypothetical protein